MDQTKVMGSMELFKNRKWTWVGHISRKTDSLDPPWVAKSIEESNEKGGEMNYMSTGQCELVDGKQHAKTIVMLRLSSCSGLIMAKDDDQQRRPQWVSSPRHGVNMWKLGETAGHGQKTENELFVQICWHNSLAKTIFQVKKEGKSKKSMAGQHQEQD